jgi:hypothetical protein
MQQNNHEKGWYVLSKRRVLAINIVLHCQHADPDMTIPENIPLSGRVSSHPLANVNIGDTLDEILYP